MCTIDVGASEVPSAEVCVCVDTQTWPVYCGLKKIACIVCMYCSHSKVVYLLCVCAPPGWGRPERGSGDGHLDLSVCQEGEC